MMKVILCVLLIAGLSGVLADPVIKKRAGQQSHCYTSEGVFSHGQVFNTARYPCLKYRCEFGMARVYEIGCPHDGSCHRIGSTWSASDCHTYTCNKRSYTSYDIQRLRSGCRDASGRCRRPGERFPYHVHGHIYQDCTCTTTPTAISYSCNNSRRGTQ
ncbi:uncharacterized protein LOC124284190 isoform X2 [Haliotis rubra]|nr:uncharacterized protein LOC124284190 isoform X2 [Haliotis rubra]XP_046576213.1 uncharacterized protein LOC124284190 isoform X2 [Haliotis rubra]XP_046576214.1 uncharacterized protein LOC124284190 isoform X2 [Haliotis rubra]